MKTLPTLYKKTNTGAIQFWKIFVDRDYAVRQSDFEEIEVGHIEIVYGQVGTDSPQTAQETITEGKNLGKANATSAYEQALAEAQASWTKQKKKGYVESPEGAEAGERDALITGGVDPMLAHHYMDVIYDLRGGHEGEVTYEKSKDAKKITFPCFGQPKLDGIRCLAVVKDGKCTLWTRTRKPILSCPHIVAQVEAMCSKEDVVLDGELYNHDLKSDFERIVSAVRKDEPSDDSKLVQYHIYDLATQSTIWTFRERFKFLHARIKGANASDVKFVETTPITLEDEVVPLFETMCLRGYEGLMLRNAASLYEGKRSINLQKAKPFSDDEFEIVGFEEGKGKLKGHLGKWICKTKDGDTFDPPHNAPLPKLKEYFENGQKYVGKLLTVRYQGYTNARKVPRFPKGHSVRDYE